jgi:hypothetical protein
LILGPSLFKPCRWSSVETVTAKIMYTATVVIKILKFKPINHTKKSSYIDAKLGPPKNTSAPGSGGAKVFGGDGQEVTVKVPKGYAGAVQVTFQLPDPSYVLIGVAMKPTLTKDGMCVGRQQFRSIAINRDLSGSQMTVTDACLPDFLNVNFKYVLLVECCTGANAGKIGVIDPEIDNEGGE